MKLLLLVIVLFLNINALADETFTAQLYEQNTNRSKKMFDYNYELKEKDGGITETVAVYKDLQGQAVFEENGVMKGSAFVKTTIQQKQTGDSATVEVVDGKIIFTKTSDGKTKTETEKLGKTMVMSVNFKRFVYDHWKEIQEGKDVAFRYGVWDRMETVGFEIFRDKESTVNGQKVIILKMKPSSFVIAALVKPLFFTYSADGTKLLELNGRVPPKLKSGDKWKDLDCEVVYSL